MTRGQEQLGRLGGFVADSVAALANVGSGRIHQARSRLQAQKAVYSSLLIPQRWWHHLLEGEIALAGGDTAKAAAAFSAGEPPRRVDVSFGVPGSLMTNNVFHDGLARATQAQGDLAGSIQIYRQLIAHGPERWVSVFEPRYVLELARLLARTGDGQGARTQYARFLDLWKHADAGLPELAEARQAVATTERRGRDTGHERLF